MLIQGTIIRLGQVYYKNRDIEMTCVRCNKKILRKSDKNVICENCGSLKFLKKDNYERSIKCQNVWVQDIGNISSISETIEVEMTEENVNRFLPGDKVNIFGLVCVKYKTLRQKEKVNLQIFLKSLTLQQIDRQQTNFFNEISVTDSQISDPFYRQKHLLSLFCDEIFGLNYVKLALFLTVIGGNPRNESLGRRSSCHILLIGNTGTGKTHLLKFISKIVYPSVFINGIGTSEAGLTTCAVKSGKEWTIEAGALVMADKGICCIDCFDMLNISERSGLLEVMEQQTLSVAKAGIVTTLNARCSIIGTYNPHYKLKNQKDDLNCEYSPNLSQKLKISSPLLSRFDLIMELIDKKSEDSSKVEKVLNRKTSIFEENKKTVTIISQLKEYVEHSKKKIVTVTEESTSLLLKYYKIIFSKNKNQVTIRMLEALTRLSEAHARFLNMPKVESLSIITAIILMECSMLNANLVFFDPDRIFNDKEYFQKVSIEVLEALDK
ncbi:DNA helicase MCM9 [Dictyocoela muelleri]|nr:DNA helicase MCM9 [Dictyocoela muelleri]